VIPLRPVEAAYLRGGLSAALDLAEAMRRDPVGADPEAHDGEHPLERAWRRAAADAGASPVAVFGHPAVVASSRRLEEEMARRGLVTRPGLPATGGAFALHALLSLVALFLSLLSKDDFIVVVVLIVVVAAHVVAGRAARGPRPTPLGRRAFLAAHAEGASLWARRATVLHEASPEGRRRRARLRALYGVDAFDAALDLAEPPPPTFTWGVRGGALRSGAPGGGCGAPWDGGPAAPQAWIASDVAALAETRNSR